MQTYFLRGNARRLALQWATVDLEDQPTKRVCSVADALSTVGDRYSLLIVREIGYGYVRFKDLVAYTGAPGARDDYRGLWGADGRDSLSRYDGLAAVRVNELGAAILHDPGALPALGLPVPR